MNKPKTELMLGIIKEKIGSLKYKIRELKQLESELEKELGGYQTGGKGKRKRKGETQADWVKKVLGEKNRPLTAQEISDVLHTEGKDISHITIRGLLNKDRDTLFEESGERKGRKKTWQLVKKEKTQLILEEQRGNGEQEHK